jgi:hypothetical protein
MSQYSSTRSCRASASYELGAAVHEDVAVTNSDTTISPSCPPLWIFGPPSFPEFIGG